MAFDPKHAAIHEAAHAVLLCLVGWENNLKQIQMRRVNKSVEFPGMTANLPASDSKKAIRSALLVYFAGSYASDAHFGKWMFDIDNDFWFAASAVARYCKAPAFKSLPHPQIGLKDPVANSLVQDAITQLKRIVRDSRVKSAIDNVAEMLLESAPNEEGICIVASDAIISVCERIFGTGTKQYNPCTDWITGN